MYFKWGKGKKGYLLLNFLSNHQTINIYSRQRSFLVSFSNQNTSLNIGKSHIIAFYILHCVKMVKTLEGVRPIQESAPRVTPVKLRKQA